MLTLKHIAFLAAALLPSVWFSAPALAEDERPIEATVTVDAARTLRAINPRRLGGTNVAMWYFPAVYGSPEVRNWMRELRPGYIRIPGGSWANIVYWNGNGVRGHDGLVDPSRVGPDGYPAVDYSDYAPSFLADPKTLHPASGNWHGHTDVKTQHEFIKAIAQTEAMACPNAGTGRALDAEEWVKWANKRMGYNVRVWEIGNELGGAWEPGDELPFGKGRITAEMYTKRYNEMAAAMRRIDPAIKIGSCPFVEEALRDCGENVDFVSIHTYPGSTTLSDSQMFGEIARIVEREVAQVRKWIARYQPQRQEQIEIAYSEWNVGFSVEKSKMFSGLWASIFLGEIARNGVDMAQQWDAFSDLLFVPDDGKYARKPQYYALWLWNNYMGDRLVHAASSQTALYTCASRSDDALCMMLINTDPEREAEVNVQLGGFTPADAGEVARVTSREYYWNPQTRRPQWSTGPRIERLKTAAAFRVTLSPFSMTYVRVPEQSRPGLSPLAQKSADRQLPSQALAKPELRFVMPAEAYVGDRVHGELIALAAGTEAPHHGSLPPAVLSADGEVTFDRSRVRLSEAVGHFSIKPASAGEFVITAQSGDAKATHMITVKPSVPRPVVFWDFTKPAVADKETFASDFALVEDLTQRANRAVARVDLPPQGGVPRDKKNALFKVTRLPGEDALKKENIRGVIFDLMTSPGFSSGDPEAAISVVMQSTANWWMPLGEIPLKDAKEWKTHQLKIEHEDHIKAMPSALSIMFILKAGEPATGSIYFDRVGFMVR